LFLLLSFLGHLSQQILRYPWLKSRRSNFSHVTRTQASCRRVIDSNAQNSRYRSETFSEISADIAGRVKKVLLLYVDFIYIYIYIYTHIRILILGFEEFSRVRRTGHSQPFRVWKNCGVRWGLEDMVGPNISLWLTVSEGAGTIGTQSASFRTLSEHERTNTELATLCKVKDKLKTKIYQISKRE